MIKTAMVLAAGLGTRMRPLTNDRCKALVTVDDKTLIDHMLDRLKEAGIERAVVNVHAFADKLEAHLGRRKTGLDIIVSDERAALLETGGGVVKALPLLGDAPILICNIDAIWRESTSQISALIDGFTEAMDERLLLTPTGNAFGYAGSGDFTLASDGRIARKTTPFAPYVFTGIQVCRPQILRGYPVERFSRSRIWSKSLEQKKMFGHVMTGHWLHVGDPQARDMAERILSEPRRV